MLLALQMTCSVRARGSSASSNKSVGSTNVRRQLSSLWVMMLVPSGVNKALWKKFGLASISRCRSWVVVDDPLVDLLKASPVVAMHFGCSSEAEEAILGCCPIYGKSVGNKRKAVSANQGCRAARASDFLPASRATDRFFSIAISTFPLTKHSRNHLLPLPLLRRQYTITMVRSNGWICAPQG